MAIKTKHKPVELLPFKLHNLKDFLIDKFPVIDPYLEEGYYKDYWTDHINKCLQGVWGHDYNEETKEGGYRWMPGNLFFYVNDTIIKMEESESREVICKPKLRDVEWYIFYALTVCDGFSGFELDDTYTSYKPLGKLLGTLKNSDGQSLSPAEVIELKTIDHLLRKPNGEYKEYVDPLTYLYKTHDKNLGKPHFHNELKNIIILATRSCGKSYSIAGGIITYDFVFGSARTSDDFFSMKFPSTVVVGSAISSKSDELLSKVIPMYEYMRENVGGFKFKNTSDFQVIDNTIENINSPLYQPFTGSLKAGKTLTNLTLDQGGKTVSGTGSKIVHITYKDNISAGVGYRARRMVVEEAGLLDNFTDVHNENEGSQKRGKKSGYTVYIGTGGDMKKIKGIREAFYNPDAYNCFEMSDSFTNKNNQIGLFIPSYYADNRFKDELGNTLIKEAFAEQESERNRAKKGGSKRLSGQMISFPIVPSEMFLQSDANLFPTELIENRLTDLETGEWDNIAKTGKLTYIDKENTKVIWTPLPRSSCTIIKSWNDEKGLTDSQLEGTIVVYEHPVDNRPELTHYNYLYLVTYDPIRDEDGGTSLACVVVWKFWDLENRDNVQFNIVAEWLGRHIGTAGMEKDHEIAFKLCSYYNAPMLPEINLKDILRHGRMTNRWYYFLPKPKLAIDGMEIKQKKEYEAGMYISPGMRPDLEKYVNEALQVVIARDHRIYDNEEMYQEIKMVSRIPSIRFCEELLYYSRDGNYDYVSNAMLFATVKRQREEEPILREKDKEDVDNGSNYLKFLEGKKMAEYNDNNPAFSY